MILMNAYPKIEAKQFHFPAWDNFKRLENDC